MCNHKTNVIAHCNPARANDNGHNREAVAAHDDSENPLAEAHDMPRSGIIDGVSNDVNMPLSVSPRLA